MGTLPRNDSSTRPRDLWRPTVRHDATQASYDGRLATGGITESLRAPKRTGSQLSYREARSGSAGGRLLDLLTSSLFP